MRHIAKAKRIALEITEEPYDFVKKTIVSQTLSFEEQFYICID